MDDKDTDLASSPTDEEGNDQFWSQMMAECQANNPNRLPSSKSLLVIGDNEVQKTQLIAKMKGIGELKLRKGNGLDYHFLTVRDEYCEHQTKLDIWVLDDDPGLRKLLKYVLNSETIADTTVLLVATMTKPWDILQCISRWVKVLDDHIQSLNVTQEVLDERKAHVLKRYQEYVEPTASIYGTLDEHINTAEIEMNLGVEIVVVLSQTEYMTTLQTDFGFIDEHFDFIQFSLRNFCLSHGAALLYLSVKEDRNCDILHKYILHKIYSLPFRIPAMFLEKDSIFVPAGWDSANKILALAESLATIVSSSPYEDVIMQPGRLSENSRLASEVEAQQDQEFLNYIQNMLLRQPAESTTDAVNRDIQISGAVTPINSTRRLTRSPQKKQLESKLNNGDGDTVLQSFFKSLLKRQTSAPGERSVANRGNIPDPDISSNSILENISSTRNSTSLSNKKRASVDSTSDFRGSGKSLLTEDELKSMEDYHARIQRALGNSAAIPDVPDHFAIFLKKYKAQVGQEPLPSAPEQVPEEEGDFRQLPEYFMSSQTSGFCPADCCFQGNAAPTTNGKHNDHFDIEPLDRVRSKFNPPLRLLLENSTGDGPGKPLSASTSLQQSSIPEILKDSASHQQTESDVSESLESISNPSKVPPDLVLSATEVDSINERGDH